MNKNDKNKSICSFFKCFLLLIAVVNLCFISIDGTAGYITDKSATCDNTFVAVDCCFCYNDRYYYRSRYLLL